MFCFLSAASLFLIAASGSGDSSERAQAKNSGRAPLTAVQPYLVMTGKSMTEAISKLQAGNATQNLMSGDAIGCRVYIQHEKDVATNQAEVHDATDDVFILLEGAATFILGGKLETPGEVQPGEWRSADISGGKEFKLAKGDMIIVPRGTPHRRISAGQDVTLMVIKAFTPAVNK